MTIGKPFALFREDNEFYYKVPNNGFIILKLNKLSDEVRANMLWSGVRILMNTELIKDGKLIRADEVGMHFGEVVCKQCEILTKYGCNISLYVNNKGLVPIIEGPVIDFKVSWAKVMCDYETNMLIQIDDVVAYTKLLNNMIAEFIRWCKKEDIDYHNTNWIIPTPYVPSNRLDTCTSYYAN